MEAQSSRLLANQQCAAEQCGGRAQECAPLDGAHFRIAHQAMPPSGIATLRDPKVLMVSSLEASGRMRPLEGRRLEEGVRWVRLISRAFWAGDKIACPTQLDPFGTRGTAVPPDATASSTGSTLLRRW